MKNLISILLVSAVILMLVGCPHVNEDSETTIPIPPFMPMVTLPSGTFMMGSNETEMQESETDDEGPEHLVTVNSFMLGETEVTEGQWEAVMTGWPDTDPATGDNYPARYLSWYDAITFCNKLSIQENLAPVYSVIVDGVAVDWETIHANEVPSNSFWDDVVYDKNANGYRLPTEAEWEYAAGGVQAIPTKWAGTNNGLSWIGDFPLQDYAIYNLSYYETPSEVKSKKPTSDSYKLYDMSGNVNEWCYDWYDENYYAAENNTDNPVGPATGTQRVIRSGSYNNIPREIRVANRRSNGPSARDNRYGFRVARNAN